MPIAKHGRPHVLRFTRRVSPGPLQRHLTHAASLDVEGTEEEPQGLERALEKLASVLEPYEPYDGSTTGTMQADYHRGRGARSGSS